MEKVENTVEETVKTTADKAEGFIEHMARFDDETKAELLNIIQYTIIGILPVVIMIKLSGVYVPDVDDSKESINIALEVLLQWFFLLIGMFFIHRFIIYFPTYSGSEYKEFHPVKVIIPLLISMASLQTKFGDKIRILIDRHLGFLFNDKKDDNSNVHQNTEVKILQPLSQPLPTHQESRADYVKTNDTLNATQQNFNDMYTSSPNTQQTNQSNPPPSMNNSSLLQEPSEPMAANEVFGGFAGF